MLAARPGGLGAADQPGRRVLGPAGHPGLRPGHQRVHARAGVLPAGAVGRAGRAVRLGRARPGPGRRPAPEALLSPSCPAAYPAISSRAATSMCPASIPAAASSSWGEPYPQFPDAEVGEPQVRSARRQQGVGHRGAQPSGRVVVLGHDQAAVRGRRGRGEGAGVDRLDRVQVDDAGADAVHRELVRGGQAGVQGDPRRRSASRRRPGWSGAPWTRRRGTSPRCRTERGRPRGWSAGS